MTNKLTREGRYDLTNAYSYYRDDCNPKSDAPWRRSPKLITRLLTKAAAHRVAVYGSLSPTLAGEAQWA